LHTPNEFAAVLRRRGLIRGVCLELLATDNTLGIARLGLIVPKRLARQAVQRNRIKRQAREAFRRVASKLPARDFVVRLHKPLPGAAESDLKARLRTEIDALFARQLCPPTEQ
jgi:ribonuclease P protein component